MSYSATAEPFGLSLIGLRQRTVRLWLAAIGMLGFGIAYASPIALALTRPPDTAAIALPELALPAVAFPQLTVPKLHAAPRASRAIATPAPAPTPSDTTPAAAGRAAAAVAGAAAGPRQPVSQRARFPRSATATGRRSGDCSHGGFDCTGGAEGSVRGRAHRPGHGRGRPAPSASTADDASAIDSVGAAPMTALDSAVDATVVDPVGARPRRHGDRDDAAGAVETPPPPRRPSPTPRPPIRPRPPPRRPSPTRCPPRTTRRVRRSPRRPR